MIPKVGHDSVSRIIPPAQGTSLPDKVDGLGVSLQDDVGLPMYLVHHFELCTHYCFLFPWPTIRYEWVNCPVMFALVGMIATCHRAVILYLSLL